MFDNYQMLIPHRFRSALVPYRFLRLFCCLAFALSVGADVALAGGVEVEVVHPTMDQRIGYPAIVAPGGVLPSLTVRSADGGTLLGGLYCAETGELLQGIPSRVLVPGQSTSVNLAGDLPPVGVYRIDLRIRDEDTVTFRGAYSFSVLDVAALPVNHSRIAHPGPRDRLRYVPDVRGNHLPDFSGVGYRGGADLPHVPMVLRLEPQPGDATQRIQTAIDEVSARAPDAHGFRGAVELAAGVYEIGGTLRIRQSGVVLRGDGPGNLRQFFLNPAQNLTLEQWRDTLTGTTATVLVATGPEHRVLLTIAGDTGIEIEEATSTEIVDDYVPVGRRWFYVEDASPFSVGDTVQLERRGNADWISYIKMDQIPPRSDGGSITQWTPFSLFFQYTIIAIDGNRITLDSGLVSAVEQRWGGGRIRRFSEGGRIRESGVENLRAVSFWKPDANGKDHTEHADQFVFFNRIRDAWARNIAAEHFTLNVSGTFLTGRESINVTFLDSSALSAAASFYQGIGYDNSGRTHLASGVYVGRYGFHFSGQNGLVRNCFATNMRHAFVVSSRVAGPNVFSDSEATANLTYSEPHHRWSVGGLYDNVIHLTSAIALMNRLNYGTGHGWAAANYVAWNTRGGLIVEQPPTAQNWGIGHVGQRPNGPFHSWNLQNYGWSHGYVESLGRHVEPASLYTAQVAQRFQLDVIYLANGGDREAVPVDAASPYSPGDTVTVMGPGDLQREHFVFTGWNTSPDGSGLHFMPGQRFTINANTTLYAQWQYVMQVSAGGVYRTRLTDVRLWTPDSMDTAAWYDAADTATVIRSVEGVSRWTDKSGNDNHAVQDTVANRPAYQALALGGMPAVSFRAAQQQHLAAANNPSLNLDGSGGVNLFAVMNSKGWVEQPSAWNAPLAKGATVPAIPAYAIRVGNDNAVGFKAGGGAEINGSTGFVGRNLLFSATRDDEELISRLFLQGALIDSLVSAGVVLSNNTFPLHLGRDASSARFADVDFGEILVVGGALPHLERQRVEGYLAHKWNLAGQLPANHAYRSAPPVEGTATVELAADVHSGVGDNLTHRWSVVSGPAPVTFADRTALATTATFSRIGTYRLRLTSEDSVGSSFDEVWVYVGYESGPVAFGLWTGGHDLAFDGDENGDGVADGLAWLLGALGPSEDAAPLLPEGVIDPYTGMLVVRFSLLNEANRGGAPVTLQYSHDLVDWTTVGIPDSGAVIENVFFSVTPQGPLNQVVASWPYDEAAPEEPFYVRILGALSD